MSSMPVVRQGVPLPSDTKRGGGTRRQYPFEQMAIGDSFDVKLRKGEDGSVVAQRVRSAAATWRGRAGADVGFVVRVVPDGVVRVWAVKHRQRFF